MDARRSFVGRLDPRTKLVGLLLLAIEVFLAQPHWTFAIPFVIIGGAIAASSINVVQLIRRLKTVIWFVIVITVVNLFTVSGTVLFGLLGIYATYDGLIAGLTLSSRIVVLLVLSGIFVQTTSVAEMIDGLEAMLRPARRRPGKLVLVISITLNFVPLLFQRAQQIKMAQTARGADVDSSFLKQVRFATSAALPLFASAFRASEHLAVAMEARCFDPTRDRTSFNLLRMQITDWSVLGLLIGSLIVTTLFGG